MEVIEVKPKRTEEQISLCEEQKELINKLLPLMQKDIIMLNTLIDKFEENVDTHACGYLFETQSALNTLRQEADEKLEFLATGDIENQAHVNLVFSLSNKYHVDNKIR